MNELEINFVDHLPDEIEKIMREDLVKYEGSYGIDVNYKRFSLILTNETKSPVGVINAFTAFSEVYVDDMWVHSSYRGKGYGRKLLQALEDHFEGKGFNNINLVTNAFNAPEFYKKCGFTEEFIRVNKVNPKLTKTFFIKHFKNAEQTQGLLKYNTRKLRSEIEGSSHAKKLDSIEIEEIDYDRAEMLCRKITANLPEYFGISSANEQYFKGVRYCRNLAAKINNQYVGLLSLNFPHENISNIYWMAVFKNHQAKGIGRQLIAEACRLAKMQNANSMTVETLAPEEADENYLKSYHFYQSLGFKPLITIKPEGYHWNMVYMVKHLTSNALNDLLSLEKDAREFGFEWPNEAMIIEQAIDECREIKEAIENQDMPERIQEEIGDLLHSAISLCEFSGFDVEKTLAKVRNKFGKRMQAIKNLTYELGLPNLKGQSIEFMMELWRKAKGG